MKHLFILSSIGDFTQYADKLEHLEQRVCSSEEEAHNFLVNITHKLMLEKGVSFSETIKVSEEKVMHTFYCPDGEYVLEHMLVPNLVLPLLRKVSCH